MLDSLSDVRYALRMLVKSPGFAAVVVVTLALGIGANSAIFSVVAGVLLRPLPYADPEGLVTVWETRKELTRLTVSTANYADWRDRNRVFASVAAYQMTSLNLAGEGEPERVAGAAVTPSFFDVLGVAPLLGRALRAGDDQPGSERVVVLGHGFWQRRFGGERGILGRTLPIDGVPYLVAGVMPEGFRFPTQADAWVPRVIPPEELGEDARHGRLMRVVARLAPGVPMERAQAQMRLIARDLERRYPASNSGWGVNVEPLRDALVGDVRKTLLVLLGAVGFILLIACANVTNLMLARSTVRQREIAVRTALGARRGRLVRQLLTESLVLTALGGAAGLLVAYGGVRVLKALEPGKLPRLDEIGIDGRVLAFTLMASVATGLLCGLAPALRTFRPDLAALKEGEGRSGGASARQHWLRGALVVAESALVLVLLLGAGLMIKSFQLLGGVDPGFETADRAALQIVLPQTKYPEPHQQGAFFDHVLERVQAIPGVLAAGAVTTLPLAPALGYYSFVEGRTYAPGEEPTAGYDVTSAGYFRALGIPLLKGRMFDDRDRTGAPAVVLVNESMAREVWPGEDPIGERIGFYGPEGPWAEVIGVVGDVRHAGLEADPEPAMYHPYRQEPWAGMHLVVHARPGELPKVIAAARAAVWSVDQAQPIARIRTLDEQVAESVARPRFNMLLLTLFSGVALVMTAVGIYGVVSYAAAQRVQEIGIRLAMGARRGDVLRLMLARGLRPVLLGAALGTVAALALGRVVASLLYSVRPTDPQVFAGVLAVLVAVAGLAVYLPSRRAARLDPLVALRAG